MLENDISRVIILTPCSFLGLIAAVKMIEIPMPTWSDCLDPPRLGFSGTSHDNIFLLDFCFSEAWLGRGAKHRIVKHHYAEVFILSCNTKIGTDP